MARKLKFAVAIFAVFGILFAGYGLVGAKKYNPRGPWIGVYAQQIDDDLKEAFELDRSDGVLISEVIDDSPADRAGLRAGDIITKFDGKVIDGSEPLSTYVADTEIGDKVEVVFDRNGNEKTTTLEIGKKPRSMSYSFYGNNVTLSPITGSFSIGRGSYIGVAIQDLNDQLGEYFGVNDGEGVLVTEVFEDSPAEEAGIKAGDVIIKADGQEVAETSELKEIIRDKEEGDELELTYLRQGSPQTAKVTVEEDHSGMNAFVWPTPPAVPAPPAVPKLKGNWLFDNDNSYFDVDEYRDSMKEYKESMKELKEEMQEMQKELETIKKKLE